MARIVFGCQEPWQPGCKLVCARLRKAGHEVLVCETSKDALARVVDRDRPADLLITEVSLSVEPVESLLRLTTEELTEKLRLDLHGGLLLADQARQKRQWLPVVFLACMSRHEARRRAKTGEFGPVPETNVLDSAPYFRLGTITGPGKACQAAESLLAAQAAS